MLFNPEYVDVPVAHLESFHPFEDGLAIMEGEDSGCHFHFAERDDRGLAPLSVLPVCDKHVIGYIFSEFKVVKISFRKTGLGCLLYRDRISKCHISMFELL